MGENANGGEEVKDQGVRMWDTLRSAQIRQSSAGTGEGGTRRSMVDSGDGRGRGLVSGQDLQSGSHRLWMQGVAASPWRGCGGGVLGGTAEEGVTGTLTG